MVNVKRQKKFQFGHFLSIQIFKSNGVNYKDKNLISLQCLLKNVVLLHIGKNFCLILYLPFHKISRQTFLKLNDIQITRPLLWLLF